MVIFEKQFSNFASVLILSCLLACSSSSDSPSEQPVNLFSYSPPPALNDGWQINDLNQLNISPNRLETLIDNIQNQGAGFLHIDSLAIAYNGELVFDQQLRSSLDIADTWAGNTDLNIHAVHSVTKSVISTLMGVAIDQQIISGVDQSIYDYFQQYQPIANWNENKQNITIENWLNMRSGYDWNEWNLSYLDPNNQNSQMIDAEDPVQFLLDTPMATTPGTTFAYSTGISYGLGRIIQNASGMRLRDYLQANLLEPLNISQYDFWSIDGQLHSGSALYFTTRDMLKFGQLFLAGGVWNNQRIVSEEWVNQSTVRRVDLNFDGNAGYGYQWWMGSYHVGGQNYQSYYANGWGGQLVYVFPQLDLVIAMTGSAYEEGQAEQRNIRDILEQWILPSFIAS
jgi:CubicO group peptidase (beta-lactamase class C family)